MSPKILTKDDLKDREKLSAELKKFMADHLFTEERFAKVSGLSRRTVQMIKAGRVSPQADNLKMIRTVIAKHTSNGSKTKAK